MAYAFWLTGLTLFTRMAAATGQLWVPVPSLCQEAVPRGLTLLDSGWHGARPSRLAANLPLTCFCTNTLSVPKWEWQTDLSSTKVEVEMGVDVEWCGVVGGGRLCVSGVTFESCVSGRLAACAKACSELGEGECAHLSIYSKNSCAYTQMRSLNHDSAMKWFTTQNTISIFNPLGSLRKFLSNNIQH